MFNLQITTRAVDDQRLRLATNTRSVYASECVRLKRDPETEVAYNFNLYTTDGAGGITILSGIAFNLNLSPTAEVLPLDGLFILDSLHLEGPAMELDNMDEKLSKFLKRWYKRSVISYSALLDQYEDLEDNTHIVLEPH